MSYLLVCALLLGGAFCGSANAGSGSTTGLGHTLPPCSAAGGTLSYNGICTPNDFPPRQNYSRAVPHPPYLKNPPSLINITKGRQLFIDDFLIASASGIATTFHTARYYDENPVIKPDQPWEGTFAMTFSGGAWWGVRVGASSATGAGRSRVGRSRGAAEGWVLRAGHHRAGRRSAGPACAARAR